MSENTNAICYRTLEEILTQVRKYHPEGDISVVERAYRFAEDAHKQQKRLSGEPYFSHPCEVAYILATLMQDSDTVAAGLLHDCVEDVKDVTSEGMEKMFGADIAQLVDGVTKLDKIDFFSREQAQMESIRKMFIYMAKDIRVVLIKLADRLHNMRTLKTQKPARQKPIAQETLDIYAPLAHRLGVYAVKWELEDLALRYIDPEGYYQIVDKIGMKRSDREDWIEDIVKSLKTLMDDNNIKCEIDGRPKHIYSIYRKMKNQGKTFDQITDLIAVRVIVDSSSTECYSVLGLVHKNWPLIPGRFKDYISVPKHNMYQSLHTTVVGRDGRPFEVQIRTREMHRTAEYGVAAHWRYKEGKAHTSLDEKLGWVRSMLEWQGDPTSSETFSNQIKNALFAEEVMVFTPRGDIVTLPKDATPLDFAYRIHSAVGHHCVGAKINKKIVPLPTPLQTGDFVEIMTNPNSHGPSLDWLNIVVTNEAKSKIRSFLKNASKDENMVRGREMLEKEAKRLGYTFSDLCKQEYLDVLYKRYSLSNQDDLYVTVGFGGLSAAQILNRLIDENRKKQKAEAPKLPEITETPREKHEQVSNNQGVMVEGDPGMLIRFAHCCNPLPGDSIIGYITRGRGVSVHRADCLNMQDEGVEPERMIRVEWASSGSEAYDADIQVISYDKAGLLADLSSLFATLEVPIVAISARTMKNGTSQITLTLSIKNTTQLEKIIKQLRKRNDIIEVFRVST